MEDNYRLARSVSMLFYLVGIILCLVVGIAVHKVPNKINIFIFAYFVITVLVIRYLEKSVKISVQVSGRIWAVLFLIMAVIISYEFNASYVFFNVLFIESLLMLVYLERDLCMFYATGAVGLAISMGITGFVNIDKKISTLHYFISLATLLIAHFIIINLVDTVEFQRRQNSEQEQSLDDLIRVIEAKCAEARKATKSKSEFLSNMSHEIRTPINAVLGMNEMILRESKDKDILEYAANVESSGKMLLSIVNDILDFSKIESGNMQLIISDYQIISVFNDLVNMIKPRADEKGLEFVLEMDSAIPSAMRGDDVRIRQIVTNLMTNAIKYTDSGRVTLIAKYEKLDENSCNLYLGVRDTGRGIKEEDKNKLFKTFQRVDEKNNRNIEGTGLGLSITKCFVGMMNGQIGVESEYGKGSLFYVIIPQEVLSWEQMGDINEQFEKSLDRRQHYMQEFVAPDANILVVDDNAMNISVVVGLLKQTKVNIDKAMSGHECLQMMRVKRYDMVLLDHMMPVMDGVETLRRIKAEKLDIGTPIVALTANAISGAREMYLDYGFQDYLTKPIVGSSLEKLLYNWLPKWLIVEVSDKEESGRGQFESDDRGLESADSKLEFNSLSQSNVSTRKWPEEMDLERAMQYSFDGEEGLMFNVGLYLDNVETMRSNLVNSYEVKDFANYAVYVHGLKSTSATIGLTQLSELALKLEKAGKSGDNQVIIDNHDRVIEMYDEIVGKLREVCS